MTSTFSGEGVGVVALPPAVPRSLHRTLLPCAPIPPGATGRRLPPPPRQEAAGNLSSAVESSFPPALERARPGRVSGVLPCPVVLTNSFYGSLEVE